MAWMLLAVFVALAGLTAVALARAGAAPERSGVRRAGGLDRRVGDDRRAADGRPHARRAHAARLGDPDLTEAQFADWYTSMGVDRALRRRRRASATSSSSAHAEGSRDLPARRPPATTACRKLGVAGPGMADDARSPSSACRASTCARSPKLARATRATRGEFSAPRGHLQRTGHEMFEVVAPVYRGGGVPQLADRRAGATSTGWIVGLFDAEPILRSVGRRRRPASR